MTEYEEFLSRMIEHNPDDVTHQIIPFENDDVPKYLENLRKFQEESRKVSILVK